MKLILVYEDIICDGKAGCRRHKLTGKKYFGGLYEGSERNEDLWLEVQQYIYDHYDTEAKRKMREKEEEILGACGMERIVTEGKLENDGE